LASDFYSYSKGSEELNESSQSISKYETMSDSNKISGDQSESSVVETSNEESNVTSPRFNKYQKARGRKAKALKPEKKQRKSKQAYDFNDSKAKEEKDRKNRLAKAEADYKEEEKRQVKEAKEAAERNEDNAKALLKKHHLDGVFRQRSSTMKQPFPSTTTSKLRPRDSFSHSFDQQQKKRC